MYEQPSHINCTHVYGWMLPREVETAFNLTGLSGK